MQKIAKKAIVILFASIIGTASAIGIGDFGLEGSKGGQTQSVGIGDFGLE